MSYDAFAPDVKVLGLVPWLSSKRSRRALVRYLLPLLKERVIFASVR